MSDKDFSTLESLLLQQIEKHAAGKNIVVALSGGIDSKALLIASNQLRRLGLIAQLSAIHVNHGIQNEAQKWLETCEKDCRALDIMFFSQSLSLGKDSGSVSEQLARESRYQFFESLLKSNDCLVVAHHQEDQAETLLFRLLRGTGLKGAAAMPETRKLGNGMLLRPWLAVNKSAIVDYAESKKLSWVEDPSNNSSVYSRNFLRNQVVPLLKSRWPKFADSFSRFTKLAAEQTELLKEVYRSDFSACLSSDENIGINSFNLMSQVRRKNLLHFWSEETFGTGASSKEISEAVRQIENAPDKSIALDFSYGKIRSFAGCLFLTNKHEPEEEFSDLIWEDLSSAATLSNGVSLSAIFSTKEQLTLKQLSIRAPYKNEVVSIRRRKGGESCCPHYRDKSNRLKIIYQECSTPVWERAWLPLVYYNDELVTVPGVFVSKDFLAADGTDSFTIEIKKGRN